MRDVVLRQVVENVVPEREQRTDVQPQDQPIEEQRFASASDAGSPPEHRGTVRIHGVSRARVQRTELDEPARANADGAYTSAERTRAEPSPESREADGPVCGND